MKSREKILLLLKDHPKYSAKKLADAAIVNRRQSEAEINLFIPFIFV